MIQSLLKHSGIYFAGLSLSKVLTVLLFVLLARLLGPSDFGRYIFFLTLAQLLTVLFDLGLVQWFQKEAHNRPAAELVRIMLPVRTTALAVSMVSAVVIITLFPTGADAVLLLLLIPEAYLSVLDGFYFHIKKSYMVALKTTFRTILMIVGVLTLGEVNTFQSTAILYLVTSVASIAWYTPWTLLPGLTFAGFRRQYSVVKSSIKYAYLIITSFAYARGDSFIVKGLLGDAALGTYGAAYRFLESLSLLPTAISHNLFPISSKEGTVGARQLQGMAALMGALGIVSGAALWLGADVLIRVVIGPEYAGAVGTLKILAFVLVLFFISAPLGTVVQSSSHIKKFLPWGVANTTANIVLNLLLVPMLGIQGAAYSMLITELTGLIINVWFVRKIYA